RERAAREAIRAADAELELAKLRHAEAVAPHHQTILSAQAARDAAARARRELCDPRNRLPSERRAIESVRRRIEAAERQIRELGMNSAHEEYVGRLKSGLAEARAEESRLVESFVAGTTTA